MTARQKSTLWLTIGAPLAVALLAWGFAKYDHSKVDRAEYNTDLGALKADIRVIKTAICLRDPVACAQP